MKMLHLLKNYLESSTIHGLTYISTTSKYVRVFWIMFIIAGFTAAGAIIYQSFETWADTPISTTTETRSIREITFPKVTVCPPKGTYTSLNFDLKNVENRTDLERENSIELKEYAFKQLYDEMFRRVMKNLTKLEENNRYFNWYHGLTKIELYNHMKGVHHVHTCATNGHVSTQYFDER